MPLWGTCLGFETISSISSGLGDTILTNFSADNLTLPLDNVPRGSRMFEGMSEEEFDVVTKENVTTHWHTYGVGERDFVENMGGYIIGSTNVDRNGRIFVSTYVGRARVVRTAN